MFIKKSSVQHKLLLAFCCLVLFPLGLFGYVSLAITKQSIEQQVVAGKLKSLGLISQKLDIMASDLTAISNIYFSNEDLRSLLLSPPDNQAYQERAKKQFLTKMIVSYRYAYTWLDYYTSIIGLNGIELHTFYDGGKIGIESLKQEPWYTQVTELNGGVAWYADPSPKLIPTVNEDHYVSAIRLIKDFENNAAIGLLMINIGEQFLYKQYSDALQPGEYMLLFDAQGKIVSATDKAKVDQSLSAAPYYERFAGGGEYFNSRIDGKDMLVTYHRMESTGWTIVCYTPVDTLLQNVEKTKWLHLILFASVLILSIIVSYVIARKLSVPIRKLYASMKKVERGDLSVRSDVQGSDEIGELAKRFNQMVARIGELRDHVIEEQEMKRRVELQNLQSQINTHFLYNTLASIRSMLLSRTPEAIDSVIVSLVKLLKKTLSAESEYITIAEEIDNLQNYVNIQSARQDEKLQVEFHIEEEILHKKTLKLLLQPLVENAIFHGIEPQEGTGVIEVRGWTEHDQICFSVTDNGVGIGAAYGDGEESGLTEQVLSSANGLGLRNVQHRIQLHFGSKYKIDIRRADQGGTSVVLRWPVFTRIEELKRT
ncbi:Sensor histidine kinase YpdA [Paenibacillus konkukensis]|uniref:Sensor histidine kinase YpdA n=1 Tax=Paenibacillus konkukensis TaxID=2020716 RepID=A0ABY4RHQ3_9BACL|nr:sensor histidine kinase [Paenibacillus konkukensis]UQZ81164.1 Sensor histidine kinase YpdA [Paenibacillus konkukensis]